MTVTALMPVKQYHPAFLRGALESLVAQTDPAWRLEIVAEPEGRADLARVVDLYLRDPRISLRVNEGRKLAGAFNTGMRHARTDFVAILFGDDMWSKDAVAVLNATIRAHPEADFFHSSRRIVDDQGEPLSAVHRSRPRVRLEEFRRGSPVKHLLCWRTELALSLGGMDESLNSVGPDDFDFPWTMAEGGAAFRAIPECLYVYRDHRSGFRLTTDLPRSVHRREIRRIMRKHGVGRLAIERHLRAARHGYLKQCLYRSRLDRWLRERLRRGPRAVWRDTYV